MIRVARNAAGNCVIFHGQTNPVYFNACLTAEVIDTDYVSIRNDISTGLGDPKYEYHRIHYSEWQSADFGTFASASDAAEYINSISNVTDAVGSGTSFAVGETMDFVQDETQTSILISNGDHHGVNSIRAIAKDNGRVGISTSVGGVEWYEIDFEDILINGSSPGNNLNAVVNALNALFTVTALGAATPAPVYTLQGGAAASWDGIETVTPAGGNVLTDFMWGSGDQYHGPRVYTDVPADYIDEPGEYYTFEVENTVSASGPFLGIGLFSVNNGDLAEITNSNLSNSGHHGYFFSNWLYNYGGYTAPWTTYGSHSSMVYGPGWNGSNSLQFRYSDVHESFRNGGTALFRCGITDNGFVGIWYYDAEVEGISGPYGARSNDWVLCARSSSAVPAGQYGLLVKIPSTAARIRTVPTRYAQDPAAPTLYYRYIESPDGIFHYPLFASAEEAEFVDAGNQSTQHVFVDEPTNATWFAPATGFTNNGTSAPTDQTYTEIVTEADALHVPAAFSETTINVDEGSSVNYPLAPYGANYTTSVSGLPAGLTFDNLTHSITGTAPFVSDHNVANPTDAYSVTVTRSNAFGSSSGTLNITVANLTAPSTAISGFTHEATSTVLFDSDTLDDGSVVSFDDTVETGKRFVIPQAWVETYVLPSLQAVNDAVILGIANGSAVWTTVENTDFDHFIRWDYASPYSHVSTIGSGGNFDGTVVNSLTSSFYDYAIELDGQDAHVIACNFNDINTQPGVENGGSFSRVVSSAATGTKTIHLAALSTQMDFAEGTIVEIDIPLGTRTFLVTEQNETTALFDGSTTPSAINAGTTYRFLYDPSVHSDDVLSFEELNGTPYTTGVTTVGTHGDYLYYVQFAVPSNVPPLRAVWNGNDQPQIPISGGALATGWSKALDFSANSERATQVSNNDNVSPIRMAGIGTTVPAGTAGNTSGDSNSQPWATSIVFNSDGNATNQHIWNQGGGSGLLDDNVYLRQAVNGDVYFGWGRSNSVNECLIVNATAGNWYGIYIASTGERLSGADASAANLADCFDIRLVNLETGAAGSNLSTAANWVSTGNRMSYSLGGTFTIGGRGTNRPFHGKVAAMAVTTLRQGVAMPSDAEISTMVRDPAQWMLDYKSGYTYRITGGASEGTWAFSDISSSVSTQVWLMGDGTGDAYSTIRNQAYPSTTSNSTLNMISMVSNDIVNVTVTGLS